MRQGIAHKSKERNISRSDEISSFFLYYLNKEGLIKQVLMYRRTYRNYVGIIVDTLRGKFPVKAILRNGNKIILQNKLEAYILSQAGSYLNDYTNEIITLSPLPYVEDRNVRVKLCGVTINSDAFSVLLGSPYRYLPVEGKIIVDVGANIGDSSIYFALRGANKVIGLEPFPKNYETANKNIKLNGLSNKIIILLAGCTGRSGFITVNPEQEGSVTASLEDGPKNGIKIRLMTLEDILNRHDIPLRGAVLKMDCEGCEYESLLSTPDNTLQRFSHILIEYHYGYKNIKQKLEKSGFNVSVTKPKISKGQHFMRFGYIFAQLR